MQLCIKSFTKPSYLKRHLLTHGVDGATYDEMKSESKLKLSFQCEFCDRKFVYKKSFSHHMKTEHAISEDDDELQSDVVLKTENECLETNGDTLVENQNHSLQGKFIILK